MNLSARFLLLVLGLLLGPTIVTWGQDTEDERAALSFPRDVETVAVTSNSWQVRFKPPLNWKRQQWGAFCVPVGEACDVLLSVGSVAGGSYSSGVTNSTIQGLSPDTAYSCYVQTVLSSGLDNLCSYPLYITTKSDGSSPSPPLVVRYATLGAVRFSGFTVESFNAQDQFQFCQNVLSLQTGGSCTILDIEPGSVIITFTVLYNSELEAQTLANKLTNDPSVNSILESGLSKSTSSTVENAEVASGPYNPVAPQAPTNVVVTPDVSGCPSTISAIVSWTPDLSRPDIVSYQATCVQASNSSAGSTTAVKGYGSGAAVVTGLEPAVSYGCFVESFTLDKVSPKSSIVNIQKSCPNPPPPPFNPIVPFDLQQCLAIPVTAYAAGLPHPITGGSGSYYATNPSADTCLGGSNVQPDYQETCEDFCQRGGPMWRCDPCAISKLNCQDGVWFALEEARKAAGLNMDYFKLLAAAKTFPDYIFSEGYSGGGTPFPNPAWTSVCADTSGNGTAGGAFYSPKTVAFRESFCTSSDQLAIKVYRDLLNFYNPAESSTYMDPSDACNIPVASLVSGNPGIGVTYYWDSVCYCVRDDIIPSPSPSPGPSPSPSPPPPPGPVNPDFYLAPNGVTVLCPNAKIGDVGAVGGVTYTKFDLNGIKNLVKNQDTDQLSKACTSGITNMEYVFGRTTLNPNITTWDTSSVTSLKAMFTDNIFFDQNLRYWNTSKVTDMVGMFLGATSFNADIGTWDTSQIAFRDPFGCFQICTFMDEMFQGAIKFDQDLSGWCVEKITKEPIRFNVGAAFQGKAAFQPKWGQPCP